MIKFNLLLISEQSWLKHIINLISMKKKSNLPPLAISCLAANANNQKPGLKNVQAMSSDQNDIF